MGLVHPWPNLCQYTAQMAAVWPTKSAELLQKSGLGNTVLLSCTFTMDMHCPTVQNKHYQLPEHNVFWWCKNVIANMLQTFITELKPHHIYIDSRGQSTD